MEPNRPEPPLAILFRDEWLVAVDKPPGQLVHPSDTPQPGDAVTMKLLRDELGQPVHLIHRLDRPTSGVLLFATDGTTARALHLAFEGREVTKTYWAVVDGQPRSEEWVCREPLRKHETAPERSAETAFHVLQRLPGCLALVEAVPKTGRFHQIRRHLLHAGVPIVGDFRYSGSSRCEDLGARLGTGSRMLLQAKSLRFRHPVTGTDIQIAAPTDPVLQQALGGSP